MRHDVYECLFGPPVKEDAENGLLEVRHDRIECWLVLSDSLLVSLIVDCPIGILDKVPLHFLKNRRGANHEAQGVSQVSICD